MPLFQFDVPTRCVLQVTADTEAEARDRVHAFVNGSILDEDAYSLEFDQVMRHASPAVTVIDPIPAVLCFDPDRPIAALPE